MAKAKSTKVELYKSTTTKNGTYAPQSIVSPDTKPLDNAQKLTANAVAAAGQPNAYGKAVAKSTSGVASLKPVTSQNYGAYAKATKSAAAPKDFTSPYMQQINQISAALNTKPFTAPYTGQINSLGSMAMQLANPSTSKTPWDAGLANAVKQINNAKPFSSRYTEPRWDVTQQALNYGDFDDRYDAMRQEQLAKLLGDYDPESDPRYAAYRSEYTRGGQQAMQDSMAQAAALTGGFGSSYGQSVGQQQYNQYMAALADKIPELEQAARSMYQSNIDTLNGLTNLDYGIWNDGRNYNLNLGNYLAGQEAQDYDVFSGERSNLYNRANLLEGLRMDDNTIRNSNLANVLNTMGTYDGLNNSALNVHNSNISNALNAMGAYDNLNNSSLNVHNSNFNNRLQGANALQNLVNTDLNIRDMNNSLAMNKQNAMLNAANYASGERSALVNAAMDAANQNIDIFNARNAVTKDELEQWQKQYALLEALALQQQADLNGGGGGGSRSSGGGGSRSSGGGNDYDLVEELRYANSKEADPYDMWAYTQDQVKNAPDLIKQTGQDPAGLINQIRRAAAKRK